MNIALKKILLSACLYLFFTMVLMGQSPSFTASVSKATVGLNEQFEVSFTLNSSGKNFAAPSFKDFHLLVGPSQSTSMEFINGNMSQSITYSYVLQPKSEGSFKIGAASIEVEGKTFKTNPINVTVTKGNSSSGNSANKSSGSSEGEASVNQNISDNIFIKAHVSKTNAFQGEAVVVTYKLYTRLGIVSFNPTKTPTFNGFWSQDIALPKETALHKEVYNGVEYNVAELKKTVLFPQRSGTLLVDPMEAESVVRIQQQRRKSRSNDPFEDFFNDPFFGQSFQDYKYLIKSEPVKINVSSLPENAPEGFSSAVGKFNMEATLDKQETKANEPVTLKIKISGKGNLKLIDPLKINFPPDMETYEPKVTENISVSENGESGSKTFEYLLIPRHAGDYKINPSSFSFFDLEKKKYITLPSPEFSLKVFKGLGGESDASSLSGLSKEEIKLLGKDIRFIKTSSLNLKDKGEFFFRSPLFYILLTFPGLFLIGFIFYRRKYMEDSANIGLVKSRKATQMAKKRLSLAQKYLKENNREQFFNETAKALWGYLSDKLGIPVSDLSTDSTKEALAKGNLPEELINKTIVTLEHCEFARYAPSKGVGEKESIYNDTLNIITEIENKLK